MSQRQAPSAVALARRMPGGTLTHEDIRFTTEDEPADVIVVLNYLRYDTLLEARKGYIWNWHNEPIVRTPFSRGFDRVFTHMDSSDVRVRPAPPILDWWVGKSFSELEELAPKSKNRVMSAIASTKRMIPGHDRRNRFVEAVSREFPNIDVFGHGRSKQLADKWDGLADYKFSIAIENTSKNDYWTEKIADCFLSYTVPLYFGARNIADYFPSDSLIWLPLDDPEAALEIIRKTIETDTWMERLPYLREARDRILYQYSLFGQISKAVRLEASQIMRSPVRRVRVHGRRTWRGGWIRGEGFSGNIKAQISKFQLRSN